MTGYLLELRPSGPGPAFRDRLTTGIACTAADARVSVIGVVVDVQLIADERPAGVKLRRALKGLLRKAGLRASWHTEAKRRTATPAKKKTRQRAAERHRSESSKSNQGHSVDRNRVIEAGAMIGISD